MGEACATRAGVDPCPTAASVAHQGKQEEQLSLGVGGDTTGQRVEHVSWQQHIHTHQAVPTSFKRGQLPGKPGRRRGGPSHGEKKKRQP